MQANFSHMIWRLFAFLGGYFALTSYQAEARLEELDSHPDVGRVDNTGSSPSSPSQFYLTLSCFAASIDHRGSFTLFTTTRTWLMRRQLGSRMMRLRRKRTLMKRCGNYLVM